MSDRSDRAATILLVDDELGIHSSLRRLLRPAGHNTRSKRTGETTPSRFTSGRTRDNGSSREPHTHC